MESLRDGLANFKALIAHSLRCLAHLPDLDRPSERPVFKKQSPLAGPDRAPAVAAKYLGRLPQVLSNDPMNPLNSPMPPVAAPAE
jgi:hypothetical protein